MLNPTPPRRNPWSPSESREAPIVPVVRLKVTLLEVVPPVWRRCQLPANLTLRRLHGVLQQLMGWKDVHLHHFRVGDELFGVPVDDSQGLKDSRWITLQDLLSRKTKAFHYEYASGEGWEHEIRIEGVADGDRTNQRPICLAGERASPPEGFRSPDDYVDRIAHSRDPYLHSRSGLDADFDPDFDPEHFDVDEVNAALASLG